MTPTSSPTHAEVSDPGTWPNASWDARMYVNDLLLSGMPNIRKWYAGGTNLYHWYSILNTTAVGPEGIWLIPMRWRKMSDKNSSMVDISVETMAKDANLTLPN